MTAHENDLGARLIRRHEGLRLLVYDDATGKPIRAGSVVVGHPTIGYGRNLAGLGISEVEAELLLSNDMVRNAIGVEAWLGPAVWRELSPERRAACMDFVHNVGLTTAMQFRATRAAIACSDWQRAHDQLLKSRYAEQVGKDPGERAWRIARILLTGRAEDV